MRGRKNRPHAKPLVYKGVDPDGQNGNVGSHASESRRHIMEERMDTKGIREVVKLEIEQLEERIAPGLGTANASPGDPGVLSGDAGTGITAANDAQGVTDVPPGAAV